LPEVNLPVVAGGRLIACMVETGGNVGVVETGVNVCVEETGANVCVAETGVQVSVTGVVTVTLLGEEVAVLNGETVFEGVTTNLYGVLLKRGGRSPCASRSSSSSEGLRMPER